MFKDVEEKIKSLGKELDNDTPINNISVSFERVLMDLHSHYKDLKQQLYQLDCKCEKYPFTKDYFSDLKTISYNIQNYYEIMNSIITNIRGTIGGNCGEYYRALNVHYNDVKSIMYAIKKDYYIEDRSKHSGSISDKMIFHMSQFKNCVYDYIQVKNGKDEDLSDVWWGFKTYLGSSLSSILNKDKDEYIEDLRTFRMIDTLSSTFDIRSDDKRAYSMIMGIPLIYYMICTINLAQTIFSDDLKTDLSKLVSKMECIINGGSKTTKIFISESVQQ